MGVVRWFQFTSPHLHILLLWFLLSSLLSACITRFSPLRHPRLHIFLLGSYLLTLPISSSSSSVSSSLLDFIILLCSLRLLCLCIFTPLFSCALHPSSLSRPFAPIPPTPLATPQPLTLPPCLLSTSFAQPNLFLPACG